MKDTAPLEGNEYEYEGYGSSEDTDWLALARSAYESSTDYLDKTHRHQFERNLSNFQSEHPKGSKYHTEAYDHRSKLFRPKTRIAVRKNESSFASALFSGVDVVKLEAEDTDDPRKRRDAAYWHEVINYRLTKTIPWYKIALGAFQEAQVYGVVVSKQYWKKTDEKDEPCVELKEIENFRLDPACDWTDPVNTSPYLIDLMPMYVCDVVEMMNDPGSGWEKYDKSTIIAAGQTNDQSDDTTKQQREKSGDESEADHHVSDFETVWVHENIIKRDGEDWIFWTLGTQLMLTEPVPLEEHYQHGIRPFVVGNVLIEAHKPYPSGTVELGQQLQAEANDNINQRMDNVSLTLNKRHYVNRNADVDLFALMNSEPGGIVFTDDPDAIEPEVMPDVTSAAYAEQNRLDADFDDIAGVFSTSSVQNNRQLNETVGGMELMSQFANKETEYLVRTFVETWVEPVLRHLVWLEQKYEEDEHIKDVALKYAESQEKKQKQGKVIPEKIQKQPKMASLMEKIKRGKPPKLNEKRKDIPLKTPQAVDVKVNVGFGNLNPDQRIKRVLSGLKVVGEIMPWAMRNIDGEEVAAEIFGALGHKNGMRFFKSFDMPEKTRPSEEEIKMKELKDKKELEEAKLANEARYNQAKLRQDKEIKYAEIASKENMTLKELYEKLGVDKERMQHEKEKAGADNLTKLAEVERKERELQFKEQTGRQGI